jgi:hypothetical protein
MFHLVQINPLTNFVHNLTLQFNNGLVQSIDSLCHIIIRLINNHYLGMQYAKSKI